MSAQPGSRPFGPGQLQEHIFEGGSSGDHTPLSSTSPNPASSSYREPPLTLALYEQRLGYSQKGDSDGSLTPIPTPHTPPTAQQTTPRAQHKQPEASERDEENSRGSPTYPHLLGDEKYERYEAIDHPSIVPPDQWGPSFRSPPPDPRFPTAYRPIGYQSPPLIKVAPAAFGPSTYVLAHDQDLYKIWDIWDKRPFSAKNLAPPELAQPSSVVKSPVEASPSPLVIESPVRALLQPPVVKSPVEASPPLAVANSPLEVNGAWETAIPPPELKQPSLTPEHPVEEYGTPSETPLSPVDRSPSPVPYYPYLRPSYPSSRFPVSDSHHEPPSKDSRPSLQLDKSSTADKTPSTSADDSSAFIDAPSALYAVPPDFFDTPPAVEEVLYPTEEVLST